MVRLIPKIEQKIWKILLNLKLKPLETPEEFIKKTQGRKHRYSSICQTLTGEKLIFYARVQKSESEKEKMITEVKVAEVLKTKNFKIFPKYFASGIEKDFEWLTRECFAENVLESKKQIEKLARPLSLVEIKSICQGIYELQKIKLSEFPFLKPKELEKFFKLPEEIRKRRILQEPEIKKIERLIKKHENFFRKENKYFCHGDLGIGNLIFLKTGELKIIDLESVMISNFAYDICFLWSRLWREKIRKKILEEFYSLVPKEKKKKFELLFQLNSIFLAFHSFCANPKEYSKRMLMKRKSFYLNLLKKATFGFSAIKNI